MRNLFLLIIVLVTLTGYSQSGTEMELSKFINFFKESGHDTDASINISGGSSISVKTIGVVPAGKVWKLTSALTETSSSIYLVLVNPQGESGLVNLNGDNVNFPFYITENTNVYSYGSSNVAISIIEYTVN